MNYNLLLRDTKTTPEKMLNKIKYLQDEKDSRNESKNLQSNSNIRDDISKVGLSNTLMGTKQVINNQNKSILKENAMSKIVVPIKQIILEFTADHIRDNAGKYAAGTMLGLGAAAGYLAGDPSHGEHLFGGHGFGGEDNNHSNPVNSHSNDEMTTIKLQNGADHHVNYKTGEGASALDHAKQFMQDRANTNYHHNVMDAVNSDPSFLTTGEKIAGAGALGAGALGAGFLSRNKKPTKSYVPNFKMK